MPEQALGVLFVCGADFRAPSEKQVLGFAQQLTGLGHRVLVSIAGDLESAREEGADGIDGLEVVRRRYGLGGLSRADRQAASRFAPDVIHAFNPRSPVLGAARGYSKAAGGAPIFVHWEDDEWGLVAGPPGASATKRAVRVLRRAGARLHPALWFYATPASLRWAGRHAVGHDALTPVLARHVEEELGRRCAVVLPVTPAATFPELPGPPLGGDAASVLFTGELHPASEPDVSLGMRAVAELRTRGRDVRFFHAGGSWEGYDPAALAREAGLDPTSAVFIGRVRFVDVLGLLQRASVLVQPGALSEFNRLRLPSKLQTYLASGTPTITYAAGFGELLEDGKDALLTHTGEPSELADRIEALISDTELRDKLARGGPAAAARLFDPVRNTAALLDHFRSSKVAA